MNTQEIFSIFSQFDTGDVPTSADVLRGGHINDTYKITGKRGTYTLQRINTNVFTRPSDVMRNILLVTRHMAEKIESCGKKAEIFVPKVYMSCDGEPYITKEDGSCYRLLRYVDGITVDQSAYNENVLREAGRAVGIFHSLTADIAPETLVDVIPDFHDTPARIGALRKALNDDIAGRAASERNIAEEILSYEGVCERVASAIRDGSVPLRVTHNDTKLDNIVFNQNTGRALCLVDLDTVMPGSLLYDFGDAVRSGATSGAEDEPDATKVSFLPELYEAFADGYLKESQALLTPRELELLPVSPIVVTVECAARFLTDYLRGDVYFKTFRPHQNLDRAKAQLSLVKGMERHLPFMRHVIESRI